MVIMKRRKGHGVICNGDAKVLMHDTSGERGVCDESLYFIPPSDCDKICLQSSNWNIFVQLYFII